jgi:hypothetical protein
VLRHLSARRPQRARRLRVNEAGDPIAEDDGFSVAESSVWKPSVEKVAHELLDGFSLGMRRLQHKYVAPGDPHEIDLRESAGDGGGSSIVRAEIELKG